MRLPRGGRRPHSEILIWILAVRAALASSKRTGFGCALPFTGLGSGYTSHARAE